MYFYDILLEGSLPLKEGHEGWDRFWGLWYQQFRNTMNNGQKTSIFWFPGNKWCVSVWSSLTLYHKVPYHKVKDAGIEFGGNCPRHWGIRGKKGAKNKHFCSFLTFTCVYVYWSLLNCTTRFHTTKGRLGWSLMVIAREEGQIYFFFGGGDVFPKYSKRFIFFFKIKKKKFQEEIFKCKVVRNRFWRSLTTFIKFQKPL